jgi:autotransporter-associated beta strand protein
LSGNITGAGKFQQNGSGTTTLSGANAYNGATNVNAGTLSLASGYTHTGTGAYTVQGGTLKIADGVDISTHAMTISLGGVISPGNSPGTAITGAQTWNDGGSYLWEINDMAGTKGDDSGWDWLDIQGTLDISATFDILITSLTNPGNVSGLADGFDYTGLSYLDPYASFTIATATGGVTGFDASAFNLNDSSFLNPKVGWSIENIGGDIILNAFFVPEPSSTALLGLGGLALALRRRRA